jgi:two-component system cell cycle sensor histidine kinase PleC
MPVDGPRASQPPTAAGPEKALAGCVDPAWLIDPAKGRVLAANAAGAARLGLRPDAASGTLDAAMPALVRLRAMLREPPSGERREPLVFWTAYGAESLLCDVAAVPADSASAAALMLVSIASVQVKRPTAAAVVDKLAVSLPPPSAPASAEDAATMTRIARAIRSGFAGGRSSASPLAAEDSEQPPGERGIAVSKLAHELRTPLSAIAAAAEIMKDQRFGSIANERYRGYTSDIHDNARHALALINLGGDASTDLGSGLPRTELDLNALAESSVSAMRPLAEEAGIRLANDSHAALPLVIADATTIKQILFNLMTNAVKFTPRGGEVRVVTGLGYDRSVFVAVQDTGVGMTAEAIAAALKADVPDNPQPKEEGGHGIGLPLARDLAKANGARLEFDSAPNAGTAVALIFPRERVVARTEPARNAAVSN